MKPPRLEARRLRALYDSIWRDARENCARNLVSVEPPPEIGDMRWGISAIFRVTALGGEWLRLRGNLQRVMGPDHIFCDHTNLHLTLQSIERFRPDVPGGDARAKLYLRTCENAVRFAKPLRLQFAGITASRSSVLAQGWPEDDRFERLRKRSFSAFCDLGKTCGEIPLTCRMNRSCHITLARITGPLFDPHGFVALIDENRTIDLGAIMFDALEMVSYQRLPDSLRIHSLGRVRFGEGDRHRRIGAIGP